MRVFLIAFLIIAMSCKSQEKKNDEVSTPSSESLQLTQKPIKSSESNIDNSQSNSRWQCEEDVCLHLRDLDTENKTFQIYMKNSVPIFGFQCDLPGAIILSSSGGLLEENEYQTSNSDSRLLSFSMQARAIPAGMGVLTTIQYDQPLDAICMTEIIFAGIGGSKLTTNHPDCLKMN